MKETAIADRSLWYGLLVPPAAWALQEWLGWFVGSRTCGDLAPAAVRWIVLGISIAALALTLPGLARGWRGWRGVGGDGRAIDPDHRDRVAFMAFGGMLVSVIFAIAIVLAGLSSAFLGDCGRMR